MTRRRNRNQQGNAAKLATALFPGSSRPSTKAQRHVQMLLSGPPTLLSSDGSGTIAAADAPTLANLAKYSSYAATWDEFRILGVRWTVQPVGVNAGVTVFYVDDEDTVVPSSTSAQTKGQFVLSCNSAAHSKPAVIPYRSQNVTDLTWYSTNSQASTQFCALKVYGNNATYNQPASTALWLVRHELLIQFRGPGGV